MIKHTFRNLSFRKKCLTICVLAGLIPVLILGMFSYQQMKRILIDRERTYLRDTLQQQSEMLNAKVYQLEQSAHYICWDNGLRKALKQNYRYNSQMFLFYRDTLDPLFAAARDLNPEIREIILYTDISIYPRTNTLEPLDPVLGAHWLEAARRDYLDHWSVSTEEDAFSLTTRIYGLPDNIQAFVKIDIDRQKVFSSLRSLYERSYGILVADSEGNTVFRFCTPDMADAGLSPEVLLREQGTLQDYVVESMEGIGAGWTLCLYRPIETVLVSVREIALLIWVVILLSLVCVLFASLWLSGSIVRPLETLRVDMEQVEKGVLEVSSSYDSQDEIGSLTRTFNHMVIKLQVLIKQLLQEKEIQKEYEMKALQAQINPHFLYNSLSLINSKAILANQPEISSMARFLSTFYRTTLNKGKPVTRVRDEIENIRSYVSIQLLMHRESFAVEYQIPEEILSLSMPNLLLQPLVENAIVHGLDCIRDGRRGCLLITGGLEENTLVFRVSDNGPGIPREKQERILLAGSEEGYGVWNVHQRVKLTCGNQYGLSYESDGAGTTAILRLPAVSDGKRSDGQ